MYFQCQIKTIALCGLLLANVNKYLQSNWENTETVRKVVQYLKWKATYTNFTKLFKGLIMIVESVWNTRKLQKKPASGDFSKRCSKISIKCTGGHPCWSVISIKLLCNFIEIALPHEFSTVNFLDIFRTAFYNNTFGGLLLKLKCLKVNFTLIHEIWLLLINYNFL